jgi:FkbM family methyltransferase
MSYVYGSLRQMTPSNNRGVRLAPLEIVAACGLVVTITIALLTAVYEKRLEQHVFFSAPALPELEPLKKYGPRRSSQFFEEWIIRDYFQDKRGGVFLDVGANHYRNGSTTYFLETGLGWSGIAVDALEEFAADYARHRPRTRYVALFASDVADSTVEFFVAKENPLVSSSNREFTVRQGAPGTARVVPTTTLNAVLDQAGLKRVDFLSMDIELAEPKALAGFDIDRFQPELVCIEGHLEVRQQILDYFAAHRYTLIGKYLRADPHNLYFRRLSVQ